ncbi:hypothetical protein KC336_g2610 [Hortaea werneckii]|nr:hypothetical protein KC336_g2610 [Hortaea werneckii]
MRYSECVCQLCGVSFNAPRIRRPDEDDDAAWGGYGYAFVTQQNAEVDCRSLSCEEDVRDHRLNDEEDEDRNLEYVTLCELEYTEHLAGPECTSTAGYTGHKISVQEMQHVISCQCLAEKRDGWISEPGDRDFEVEAERCFLTGSSRGGVYRYDVRRLAPVRHGVSTTDIHNDSPAKLGRGRGEMRALPMHPRCFELFQRVSLRCFGRVDIDGLWRLREEKGSYVNWFEGMPRNPDVELVSEEWNSARPGTEYLAADPIDVPGLSTLIKSCLLKEGDVCESVFDACEHIKNSAEHSDPFTRLPPELQHILLKHLWRQDVANLRLVSPVFKHLPQTYFRHLVETEMPWLWEVSGLPKHQIDFYRLWCRLHEADGGSQQDLHERQWLEQTPRKKLDALRDELENELESKGMSAIPALRT